jgi:hypothetical protein
MKQTGITHPAAFVFLDSEQCQTQPLETIYGARPRVFSVCIGVFTEALSGI